MQVFIDLFLLMAAIEVIWVIFHHRNPKTRNYRRDRIGRFAGQSKRCIWVSELGSSAYIYRYDRANVKWTGQ